MGLAFRVFAAIAAQVFVFNTVQMPGADIVAFVAVQVFIGDSRTPTNYTTPSLSIAETTSAILLLNSSDISVATDPKNSTEQWQASVSDHATALVPATPMSFNIAIPQMQCPQFEIMSAPKSSNSIDNSIHDPTHGLVDRFTDNLSTVETETIYVTNTTSTTNATSSSVTSDITPLLHDDTTTQTTISEPGRLKIVAIAARRFAQVCRSSMLQHSPSIATLEVITVVGIVTCLVLMRLLILQRRGHPMLAFVLLFFGIQPRRIQELVRGHGNGLRRACQKIQQSLHFDCNWKRTCIAIIAVVTVPVFSLIYAYLGTVQVNDPAGPVPPASPLNPIVSTLQYISIEFGICWQCTAYHSRVFWNKACEYCSCTLDYAGKYFPSFDGSRTYTMHQYAQALMYQLAILWQFTMHHVGAFISFLSSTPQLGLTMLPTVSDGVSDMIFGSVSFFWALLTSVPSALMPKMVSELPQKAAAGWAYCEALPSKIANEFSSMWLYVASRFSAALEFVEDVLLFILEWILPSNAFDILDSSYTEAVNEAPITFAFATVTIAAASAAFALICIWLRLKRIRQDRPILWYLSCLFAYVQLYIIMYFAMCPEHIVGAVSVMVITLIVYIICRWKDPKLTLQGPDLPPDRPEDAAEALRRGESHVTKVTSSGSTGSPGPTSGPSTENITARSAGEGSPDSGTPRKPESKPSGSPVTGTYLTPNDINAETRLLGERDRLVERYQRGEKVPWRYFENWMQRNSTLKRPLTSHQFPKPPPPAPSVEDEVPDQASEVEAAEGAGPAEVKEPGTPPLAPTVVSDWKTIPRSPQLDEPTHSILTGEPLVSVYPLEDAEPVFPPETSSDPSAVPQTEQVEVSQSTPEKEAHLETPKSSAKSKALAKHLKKQHLSSGIVTSADRHRNKVVRRKYAGSSPKVVSSPQAQPAPEIATSPEAQPILGVEPASKVEASPKVENSPEVGASPAVTVSPDVEPASEAQSTPKVEPIKSGPIFESLNGYSGYKLPVHDEVYDRVAKIGRDEQANLEQMFASEGSNTVDSRQDEDHMDTSGASEKYDDTKAGQDEHIIKGSGTEKMSDGIKSGQTVVRVNISGTEQIPVGPIYSQDEDLLGTSDTEKIPVGPIYSDDEDLTDAPEAKAILEDDKIGQDEEMSDARNVQAIPNDNKTAQSPLEQAKGAPLSFINLVTQDAAVPNRGRTSQSNPLSNNAALKSDDVLTFVDEDDWKNGPNVDIDNISSPESTPPGSPKPATAAAPNTSSAGILFAEDFAPVQGAKVTKSDDRPFQAAKPPTAPKKPFDPSVEEDDEDERTPDVAPVSAAGPRVRRPAPPRAPYSPFLKKRPVNKPQPFTMNTQGGPLPSQGPRTPPVNGPLPFKVNTTGNTPPATAPQTPSVGGSSPHAFVYGNPSDTGVRGPVIFKASDFVRHPTPPSTRATPTNGGGDTSMTDDDEEFEDVPGFKR